MENVIVFIISIIFIIIGIAFGGFKDGYPQKIARKKATEVKRLIEYVYKMEYASNIEEVVNSYYTIYSEITELISLKRSNPNAFNQVLTMGKIRYEEIHSKQLTSIQQKVLSLNEESLKNVYSQCLINTLQRYSSKTEMQINKLKTDEAKEKRRNLIIDSIKKCVIELNHRGNPEYITMIPNIVSSFNICIDIKRTSDENQSKFRPNEYVRKINESKEDNILFKL